MTKLSLLLPTVCCLLPLSAFAQVDRVVGKPFATRSQTLGRPEGGNPPLSPG